MAAPAEAVCSFPLLILGFEPIYLYCTVCWWVVLYIQMFMTRRLRGTQRCAGVLGRGVVCTVQRGGAHFGGPGDASGAATARGTRMENRDRCQLFWQSQRLVLAKVVYVCKVRNELQYPRWGMLHTAAFFSISPSHFCFLARLSFIPNESSTFTHARRPTPTLRLPYTPAH